LTTTTAARPKAVVGGRLDGDSLLDVAVLSQEDGRLDVYSGNGGGGFSPIFRTQVGQGAADLRVRDVNGDGRSDLLVINERADQLVLFGDGRGSFRTFTRLPGSVILAVDDLDRDGRDDFIYATPGRDRIFVDYSGAGPSFVQDVATGLAAPSAVLTGDITGDGLLDLAAANSGGNQVLVYPGTGEGQFGAAVSYAVGSDPQGLLLADVSGDGWLDVVTANFGSNDVSVLVADRNGGLLPEVRYASNGIGPVAITLADFNGDPFMDLVVTNNVQGGVTVLPGRGNGFLDDRDFIRRVGRG
jgi:hypothetical protein